MSDVHIHVSDRAGEVLALVNVLLEKVETMTGALLRLKTEVEESTAVAVSAIKLIEGLAQQIRDAADDPEQLRTLADKLDASSAALAAAVEANTVPVVPPPVMVPPVDPPTQSEV